MRIAIVGAGVAGLGAALALARDGNDVVVLERDAAPNGQAFNGADLGYLKYAIFRGDNSTFSITLAYASDDEEMKALRAGGMFDAATRAIPAIAEWMSPEVSEPISGVLYMGGLINRVRQFLADGEPIVLGLHAVGDASVCTNPLYGRGCSLGLLHGVLFADTLRKHTEPRDFALAFDDATQRELVPWYVASKQQDAVNMKVQRGEELSDFDAFVRSLIQDGLFPAARVHADVSRAWFRTFNLLTKPDALITDPDLMRVMLEFYNERESRPKPDLMGPPREEFMAAVAAGQEQ